MNTKKSMKKKAGDDIKAYYSCSCVWFYNTTKNIPTKCPTCGWGYLTRIVAPTPDIEEEEIF